MKNVEMIINEPVIPLSVAGGYWTGSSTIVDLLAEHSECTIVPEEFTLFSFGQFFQEVYSPLVTGSPPSDLFDKNLFRLCEFNRSDIYPLRAVFRRIFGLLGMYPKLFFSQRQNMKERLGGEYSKYCDRLVKALQDIRKTNGQYDISELHFLFNKVLEEAAKGADHADSRKHLKFGVFDQLVAPPYIQDASIAIPGLRYINVDRDWRDQYVSMREPFRRMMARNRQLGVRPWDENLKDIENSPIPFFLGLRKKINRVKEAQANGEMLWVWYEDVVLNRDVTAKKVFDFLDLDPTLWTPDQYLHPEVSRKRIHKWKKGKWLESPLKEELEILGEELDGTGYEN